MKKFKDIKANVIHDDNKIYQNGKKINDFFEYKAMDGVFVIRDDKVLFAENYKTYKKATEAYETIVAILENMGLCDNKTSVYMWNWFCVHDGYCLLTKDTQEKSNNIGNKCVKFLFEELTEKQRKQIKELHINKKNMELLAWNICDRKNFDNLFGYPVIIDDSVTEDFEVIYEEN